METTAFMFKGFKATLTNHDGATSPCFVVNENRSLLCKDGTMSHCYKVKTGTRILTGGWSGGGGSYATTYSQTAIWVKAERVSK